MIQAIYQRKVGAFELVVAVALAELLVGSGPRAIVFGLLAVGCYYAKRHFKGEFSLAQLHGLLKEKT